MMITFLKNILVVLSARNLRLTFLISFILLVQKPAINAQGIHFSQFYAAPLLTNPANTGLSSENIRIANIYRNQWTRIGIPFQTFGTSADKKLIILNQTFGIGGFVLHDQSSSFNLSANEFMISLSYSKIIHNQQFTFGLQSGMVYKSYDLTNMTFNSQFSPSGMLFDASLPSLENGLDDRLNYFDLNAGISWHALIHNMMSSAGISISHVNMPEEKFSTSSYGIRLPIKVNFNSGVIVPVNSRIYLEPVLFYSYTPGSHEFLLGSLGDYSLDRSNIPVQKVFAVTMFRLNPVRDIDAIILGGGAEFLNFSLGLTYDFNISPLHKATNFNGAFEISFIYKGKNEARKISNQPCYIMN